MHDFMYHNLAEICVHVQFILVFDLCPTFFWFDPSGPCCTMQILRIMVCFLGILDFDMDFDMV